MNCPECGRPKCRSGVVRCHVCVRDRPPCKVCGALHARRPGKARLCPECLEVLARISPGREGTPAYRLDDDRLARIARYTERAAAELPLFDAR